MKTAFPMDFCCGINLGNSLDCFTDPGKPADETGWGNPRITRELIHRLFAAGFRILRVPVTWDGHFAPSEPWTVSPEWMNRV